MTEKFIHIDLFSGIGGFTLGLHQAGVPIDKIYFSEIDKYAISVYGRNFPNAEYLGSVDTISGRRFKGRKSILTFGFPCQDLSVAGKRKGFDGSRSSLFFEAMRIISEVRPDIFIFENVKGFYSSNNGKDFTIALQTIADLGLYDGQWQLLNTAWFLPQNRERVYFVGSLRNGCKQKIFPIRQSGEIANQWHPEVTSSLQCPGRSSGNYRGMTMVSCPVLTPDRLNKRQNGRRFKDNEEPMFSLTTQDIHGVCIGDFRKDEGLRIRKDQNSPSLCARARQDGSGQPVVIRKADERINGKMTAKSISPSITATNVSKNSDQQPLLYSMGNAKPGRSCIGAGRTPEVGNAERSIRRLTPIECERLQGFPDNWTKYGKDGIEISDTQRYKMCGNAVSVPVVKAIGERLT